MAQIEYNIQFCHISPTPYLDVFCKGRPFHLTLAHLIEVDDNYTEFYRKETDSTIIMDNSAFEMYKQGRPMYPSDKLIEMGKRVNADYIVMSDYPGQESNVTINKAIEMAPELKKAGFGTFFVPQSEESDLEDYISGFQWAADHPELIDYVGVSILGAPLAFGVERDNKLQRFLARWRIMGILKARGILRQMRLNGQKIHFLGMVDGPNEISLVKEFHSFINTWDSSAAIWLGLNGGEFDNTPTGLLHGKFEKEVDFDFPLQDNDDLIETAFANMHYIDLLCVGDVR